MWESLKVVKTTGTVENFRKAVELIIKKPEVLRGFYCGATVLKKSDINPPTHDELASFVITVQSHVYKITCEDVPHPLWKEIDKANIIKEVCEHFTTESSHREVAENHVCTGVDMYIQTMIPKRSFLKKMNLYIVAHNYVLCVPLFDTIGNDDEYRKPEDYIYKIEYKRKEMALSYSIYKHDPYIMCLQGWMTLKYDDFNRFAHFCSIELTSPSSQSLQLIDLEEYNDLYNQLKKKYADFLISNWNEKTDAQKFVFEDIAIATYLLLLFKDEQKTSLSMMKKQSFLDIGCGNGLLVYLLTKEGYSGAGFDIRKRKIWDWFEGVDLRERTVIPSSEELFPEYDWLIGNHSDEMTPWIPVISARSGYDKRFFVLPCCPHDFNGKFRERKAGLSTYEAYLQYVETVAEACGFAPEVDKLKIPSTKRTCIVGRTRTYKPEDSDEAENERSVFIQKRCDDVIAKNAAATECTVPPENHGFVPRPKEEKVRNCTKIDNDLKRRIVNTVFDKLTDECNSIEINGKEWNQGKTIPLGELVQLFDKETLGNLKNECGGLQTLLKNHHQVFQVVKGLVSLRFGEGCRKRKRDGYYKTSLCYFHENHLDGCWQSADLCSYAHGEGELREFQKND